MFVLESLVRSVDYIVYNLIRYRDVMTDYFLILGDFQDQTDQSLET
jgi:hypothetical protein